MGTSDSTGSASALDPVTLLGFVAIVLMAGSNVVAVRFSNRDLDPMWGAGLRFALAAILLFVAMRAMRLPSPRGRALLGAALYGALTFGAFFAFAYWGLLEVPAGLASLLLASVPLLTFLLAWVQGIEPFRWRGLVGAVVAMTGIAVMFVGPVTASIPVLSMLAILAGAACAAEATVLIKLFPRTHPIATNAVGMSVGATLLLALSLGFGEAWRLPTLASAQIAVGYLVIFGSFVLFVVYVFVIQRWTASGVSYQFVFMPIVAFVLSAWLEGERIGFDVVLGGVLVLLGVFVGALWRPRDGA